MINRILVNFGDDVSPILREIKSTHSRLWVIGDRFGHLMRRRMDYLKAYGSYIGMEWLPWEHWLIAKGEQILYPSMSLYYMKLALEETKASFPFPLQGDVALESLARDLLAYQDDFYRSDKKAEKNKHTLLAAMDETVLCYEKLLEKRSVLGYYPALLRGRDDLLADAHWEVDGVVIDMVTKLWPWQWSMIEEMLKRNIPVYLLSTEAYVPTPFGQETVRNEKRGSGTKSFHSIFASMTEQGLARVALQWAYDRKGQNPVIVLMHGDVFSALERAAYEWHIPLVFDRKVPIWQTAEGLAVRQWLAFVYEKDVPLPVGHCFLEDTMKAVGDAAVPSLKEPGLSRVILAVSEFWQRQQEKTFCVWSSIAELAKALDAFVAREQLSRAEEKQIWENELKSAKVNVSGEAAGLRVMTLEDSLAKRTGPRFYLGLDQSLDDKENLLFYRAPFVEEELKQRGFAFPEEVTEAARHDLACSIALADGVVAGGFVVDKEAENPLKSGANWLEDYITEETEIVLLRAGEGMNAPLEVNHADDVLLQYKMEARRRRDAGDDAYRGQWATEDIPVKRSDSVTALERFAQCPFRYGWELLLPEENEESDFRKSLGTLLHAVLERIYQCAVAKQILPLSDTMDEVRIKNIFTQMWNEQIVDDEDVFLPLKKSFWEERLLAWIRKDVERLNEIKGKYRPYQLEKPFTTSLPSHPEVRLTGKIDRIDQNEAGQKIIIDYKTNATPKFRDIQEGSSLQMGLYACAEGFSTVDAAMYGSIKQGSTAYIWRREGVDSKQVQGRTSAYSQMAVEELLEDVAQLAEKKNRGAFLVEPRKCYESKCAYYGVCRYQGGEEDGSATIGD